MSILGPARSRRLGPTAKVRAPKVELKISPLPPFACPHVPFAIGSRKDVPSSQRPGMSDGGAGPDPSPLAVRLANVSAPQPYPAAGCQARGSVASTWSRVWACFSTTRNRSLRSTTSSTSAISCPGSTANRSGF